MSELVLDTWRMPVYADIKPDVKHITKVHREPCQWLHIIYVSIHETAAWVAGEYVGYFSR